MNRSDRRQWKNRMIHEEVGDVIDSANAVAAMADRCSAVIMECKSNSYAITCAKALLTTSLLLKEDLSKYYRDRINNIIEAAFEDKEYEKDHGI